MNKNTLKIIITVLAFFGLIILMMPLNSDATLAQSRATPTNIGGGDGDDGGGGTPVPPPAQVSGFVYNYSTMGREGGVTVVIDGGGWQAEAVTDSNGYYVVGNLGTGTAVMNLRLPPGTEPVVYDYPVQLDFGDAVEVNLGYYWGDEPPMPILASGTLNGNVLTVQVENRTNVPAEDAASEVQMPRGLRVAPGIQTNMGEVVGYDSVQPRIEFGDIAPGETAQAVATLTEIPSVVEAGTSLDPIQLMLTYEDQPTTVQMRPVSAAPFMAFFTGEESAAETAAASAGETTAPAGTADDSAAFAPPASQTESGDAVAAAPQAAPAEEPSALPVTGDTTAASNPLIVALAALVALGLAGAGWWSMQGRAI